MLLTFDLHWWALGFWLGSIDSLSSCPPSLEPRPKEKEFVVPLIRKNVWRIPQKREKDGSRSSGRERKSEEERALDKEAAEAIMKGVCLYRRCTLYSL